MDWVPEVGNRVLARRAHNVEITGVVVRVKDGSYKVQHDGGGHGWYQVHELEWRHG